MGAGDLGLVGEGEAAEPVLYKERVLKTKEENDRFKSFLKFEDGEELWLDLEKEKAKYF